jgi:uncharacterized membrane protein YkoI
MDRLLIALLLAIGLSTAAAVVGPSPASAQTCYSAAETRAVVQSGQILPLSSLIGQIQAVAPGQIVSSQLCMVGGRYVYLVSVLVGGQVHQLRVDAASGGISY